MGSSLSTSNNSSNQLELLKKNADKVDKYQNDIQQLSTKLSEVTSGLDKALVQQRTDSIELYQDMEEKLKLAEAEIGRLKKENFLLTLSSTSKLPKETLERIFTIQQQIVSHGEVSYDYNKNFQELLLALVSIAASEEVVNEFLATQELSLSSINLNGCLDKESRARHEKFVMKIVRMREEGQERMI